MVEHDTELDCPECSSENTHVTGIDDMLHCEDCGFEMLEIKHEDYSSLGKRFRGSGLPFV